MYARALGIPESQASNTALAHPMGRAYGDDVFISSIANFNQDGSIGMYCRVLPNSEVEIMNPLNAVEIARRETEASITTNDRLSFLLEMNKPLTYMNTHSIE